MLDSEVNHMELLEKCLKVNQ